eukprot:1519352-Lingulodinium_polyedra.AAC.1
MVCQNVRTPAQALETRPCPGHTFKLGNANARLPGRQDPDASLRNPDAPGAGLGNPGTRARGRAP